MHIQLFSAFRKAYILLPALALAFTLPFISLPEFARADLNNTRADSWGTWEYGGSSWLGGGGVDVYSNGATASGPSPDTYNCFTISGGGGGLGCGSGTVPTGIKWQCVELVNRLAMSKGWITSRWSGNGNTLKDSIPTGWTKEDNDHISYINSGDVITFDQAGTSGHAAVVNTVGGTIEVINQNTVAVKGNTSVTSGSLAAGTAHLSSYLTGYTVQAVIHHPNATNSRPAAITRSSGTMDVFYRDTSSSPKLINIGWDYSSNWGTASAKASGGVSSNPTAVARDSANMDVFYRDTSNNLQDIGWNATTNWGSPVPRVSDGSVVGDPVAVTRSSGTMDVFYHALVGGNNKLMAVSWDASGWSAPYPIVGSGVSGSPTAVALDANHMDIFYRDSSNDLVSVEWYYYTGFTTNVRVSGTATGDFTAIARGSTNVDVFYPTTAGGLGNEGVSSGTWSNQTWTGSNVIATPGASFVGTPTAMARDSGHMQVFYQDSAGNLVEKGWDVGIGWFAPVNRASNIGDNPAGVSRDSNDIDVFFRDPGGNLTDQGWNVTNSWSQTHPLGASGMA